LILGLTGGYCAGKSTVADLLAGSGWRIVNMDKLGHRALVLAAADVGTMLGPTALDSDGTPDRRAIGKLVFTDPSLMARFEAIVHPVMNRLAEDEVRAAATENVCVDAALLYRLPILQMCDEVIEVRAPLALRLIRAWQRDRLGPVAAIRRIVSQHYLWNTGNSYTGKRHIVINNGSREHLVRQIGQFCRDSGVMPDTVPEPTGQ
jgi:dephospho-CoA kinase